jgi:hypothetical protein
MHSSVNPRRFVGQPVLLHRCSKLDYVAAADGLRVGRISQVTDSGGKSCWLWTLTGPHCGWPVDGVPVSGTAANAVAARQLLTRSFEAWLSWALLQNGQVHWHWTEAAGPVFNFVEAAEKEPARAA